MSVQTTSNGTSLVARIKGILFHPTAEWPKIADEESETRDIFKRYVLPLALIAPVCGLIGGQVFGYTAYGVALPINLLQALIGSVVALGLGLGSFLLLVMIADSLAPRFGSEAHFTQSYKLVAYATTPAWLVGLFALFPPLEVLSLLALYSLWLIYAGAGPLLGLTKAKAKTFTLVFVLAAIGLNVVVVLLSAANFRFLAGMGLLG